MIYDRLSIDSVSSPLVREDFLRLIAPMVSQMPLRYEGYCGHKECFSHTKNIQKGSASL